MSEDDLWADIEDVESGAWERARGVDADVILAAAAGGDSDAQLIRAQAE
jgi:hypothetical protein